MTDPEELLNLDLALLRARVRRNPPVPPPTQSSELQRKLTEQARNAERLNRYYEHVIHHPVRSVVLENRLLRARLRVQSEKIAALNQRMATAGVRDLS